MTAQLTSEYRRNREKADLIVELRETQFGMEREQGPF